MSFFAFTAMAMIGVGGMVMTHNQEQEVLPVVPSDGDDLSLAAIDQITTGMMYDPDHEIRERFAACVDVLNASHVHSELGPDYAKSAVRNHANNFIIFTQRKRGQGMIIVGFAVGYLEMRQGIIFAKIDVLLCEQGAGRPTLGPLLNLNFENFRAMVSREANTVCFYLLSAPGQIDFYVKNGFERFEQRDEGCLAFMGLVVKAPRAVRN